MKYVTNADTAKKIDNLSINEFGIPSLVLMERAAYETAAVIMKEISRDCRILAACGRGNNGGDAIAAARILYEFGYNSAVCLVCEESELSEQASQQFDIAIKCGVQKTAFTNYTEFPVIIDGIYGVGLNRAITGDTIDIISKINESSARVYAVDIPSGIHATTGAIMGTAVKADVTVTFGNNKTGIILFPGSEYAGNIIVADIGFPKAAVTMACPQEFIYEKKDIANLPERKRQSNKGTYGKVLVIAGSIGMCGAAYLSAKAAYRTGCGLVKIMTHEDNRIILQSKLPEALLAVYSETNKLTEDFIKKQLDWADAVVIGPGIGQDDTAVFLVSQVLSYTSVPLVIDADAINIIASTNMYSKILERGNLILTPHLKEMSRLWKCSIEEIKKDIVSFARNNSSDKVIYILKDARTIVSDGEKSYINISGNNGMSTAGSGDVLTGIIASLIAQGMNNYNAATYGVYIHGIAGDYAAEKFSKRAMIASDIIDSISLVDN